MLTRHLESPAGHRGEQKGSVCFLLLGNPGERSGWRGRLSNNLRFSTTTLKQFLDNSPISASPSCGSTRDALFCNFKRDGNIRLGNHPCGCSKLSYRGSNPLISGGQDASFTTSAGGWFGNLNGAGPDRHRPLPPSVPLQQLAEQQRPMACPAMQLRRSVSPG